MNQTDPPHGRKQKSEIKYYRERRKIEEHLLKNLDLLLKCFLKCLHKMFPKSNAYLKIMVLLFFLLKQVYLTKLIKNITSRKTFNAIASLSIKVDSQC